MSDKPWDFSVYFSYGGYSFSVYSLILNSLSWSFKVFFTGFDFCLFVFFMDSVSE